MLSLPCDIQVLQALAAVLSARLARRAEAQRQQDTYDVVDGYPAPVPVACLALSLHAAGCTRAAWDLLPCALLPDVCR